MKPVAVINVGMLTVGDIDQPKKLHEAGYTVIFVNDGPGVILHSAPQTQRERIATAVYAQLLGSSENRIDFAHETAKHSATLADILIKELNK